MYYIVWVSVDNISGKYRKKCSFTPGGCDVATCFFLITFLDLKSVKKSLLQGPDFEGESKRGEETRVCLVRSGGVLVASRRAGKVHPYNATTTSLRTNSLDYTVRSCHETTRAESPLQRHGLRPKALCVFSKTKLEKLTTKKKTPRHCPRLGAV